LIGIKADVFTVNWSWRLDNGSISGPDMEIKSGYNAGSNLSGQTAVVTGGAGTLGLAMVTALVERGVAVAIIGRDEVKTMARVEELNSSGGRAIGILADVVDRTQLEAARDRIADEFGGVDILINAAGGNHPRASTSDTLSARFSGV